MPNTPSRAFQNATGRLPGRVHPFTQETPKPLAKLPPEAMFHFWHPEREGVELCPRDFDDTLKTISPDLFICRPPARVPRPADQRWIVWNRRPANQYWLCPGWQLLFLWPPTEYEPIPLDNRVFANLAAIDARRYPSAVHYFDRIVNQTMREKGAQRKADANYRGDRNKDYWDATKIKNIGHGSKFALHHDGTVMPSRQEQNWLRSRGAFLPGEEAARAAAEVHQSSTQASMSEMRDAYRIAANSQADREFQQQVSLMRLLRERKERVALRRG